MKKLWYVDFAMHQIFHQDIPHLISIIENTGKCEFCKDFEPSSMYLKDQGSTHALITNCTDQWSCKPAENIQYSCNLLFLHFRHNVKLLAVH